MNHSNITSIFYGPKKFPKSFPNLFTFDKHWNGILFFDEYEKISNNKDIVSLLLHVTDPQQNLDFRDN